MLGNIDAVLLGSDGAADGNLHIPGCSLRGFNINSVFAVRYQVSSGSRDDGNGADAGLVDIYASLVGCDAAIVPYGDGNGASTALLEFNSVIFGKNVIYGDNKIACTVVIGINSFVFDPVR